MRYFFLILSIGFLPVDINAQEISFKDTIAAYNLHRINMNKTGMKVLGSWGLVNIGVGCYSYYTTKQDEMKYFSEMNVLWGAVNMGIAAISLASVRKEMAANLNYEQSYQSYLSTKRLYLINAGLDVIYIGAGVGLTAYSRNVKKNEAIYSGFGKSVAIQGVFLLLFDNIMFSAHHLDNSKWFRIMNEIRFTNKGIGYSHTF